MSSRTKKKLNTLLKLSDDILIQLEQHRKGLENTLSKQLSVNVNQKRIVDNVPEVISSDIRSTSTAESLFKSIQTYQQDSIMTQHESKQILDNNPELDLDIDFIEYKNDFVEEVDDDDDDEKNVFN